MKTRTRQAVLFVALFSLVACTDQQLRDTNTALTALNRPSQASATGAQPGPIAGNPNGYMAGGSYPVGERVEVEWQGDWWAAEVIDAKPPSHKVHYIGWESSWDEWVDPARIRGPVRTAAVPLPRPNEPNAIAPAPAAPPAGGGCQKDTDCKGDRVCERGVCVTPSAP